MRVALFITTQLISSATLLAVQLASRPFRLVANLWLACRFLRVCRQSGRLDLVQREYPSQALAGVGALIVENGRVLLIKRGKAPLLGEWSIPGGLLELGETTRQAAEREAFEETGMVVRATELLGVFDRIVRDDEQRTLYHYVLIDFFC